MSDVGQLRNRLPRQSVGNPVAVYPTSDIRHPPSRLTRAAPPSRSPFRAREPPAPQPAPTAPSIPSCLHSANTMSPSYDVPAGVMRRYNAADAACASSEAAERESAAFVATTARVVLLPFGGSCVAESRGKMAVRRPGCAPSRRNFRRAARAPAMMFPCRIAHVAERVHHGDRANHQLIHLLEPAADAALHRALAAGDFPDGRSGSCSHAALMPFQWTSRNRTRRTPCRESGARRGGRVAAGRRSPPPARWARRNRPWGVRVCARPSSA